MSRTSLIVITICTMLATLMQALDSTIANVALPYMQGSMAASQTEIDWVLTSYIVASAIMTAPSGALTSRFGRTRVLVVSIIGFTVTSILCGMAQTLGQLVIFRIMQGLFGGSLVPLSQAVLYDIFPPKGRASAMALWGMGVQIGPVLGPIVGGWLTQNYSWRWVFYVNVPFGIIAATGLIICLKETPTIRSARLDWLGFLALGLAVGAFQMLLDRGEQLDWFSSREIIIEACFAGLGLYLFLVQLALAPKPFLSPRLFTDANFVICVVCIFIVGLILYATLALLAPYVQNLMDYPVITAGVVLAPRGFGTMFAMVLSGRLVGKVGARPLAVLGFLISAYALYAMTRWDPDVSESAILVVGLLQGLGVGFIFLPLSTIVFATLPLELRTEAAGVYALLRNLGSAIGISVTGALLETNTQINHAIIGGAVTPFNRALQSGTAAHFWNPASPGGAAVFNNEITRQANIIAYVDDFKLMLILSIAALPLVMMIRPNIVPVEKSHAAVME